MNRKIIIISFFVVFLFHPILTKAQTDSNTNNEIIKRFGSGTIIKKDRKRFTGKRLLFDSQNIIFKDSKTAETVSIPLSDIEYVRAKTGTHALEGALIGGGLFLLAALAAYLDVESDPNTEVTNAGEVILITTGIGFGGGLLIGAMLPKEKTVYQKGEFLVDVNIPQRIKPLKSKNNVLFVALQFYF